MGKQIITLEDILMAAESGATSIPASSDGDIITATARDKAEELGIALPGEPVTHNSNAEVASVAGAMLGGAASDVAASPGGAGQVVAQVVDLIAQQADGEMNADDLRRVVTEVVAKRLADASASVPAATLPSSAASSSGDAPRQGKDGQYTDADGVFLVECERLLKGASENGTFVAEGVNCTCADLSGAIMQWENATLPRTMETGEIAVVIEGELKLSCNGKTLVGKPGDMLYLPAGADVEYAADKRVRLACVSAK